MKRNIKPFLLMIAAGTAFLLATVAEFLYNGDLEYGIRRAAFNKILVNKEIKAGECLQSLKNILEKGEDIGSVSRSDLNRVIRDEGITILDYLDGRLVYWSDNSFEVPVVFNDTLFSKPFVFIHNGWFITRQVQVDRERIIALVRVLSDYGFENRLVRNGFEPVFRMPEGSGLTFNDDESEYPVYAKDGTRLFLITWPPEKGISWFTVIPAGLWLIALILIMICILEVAGIIARNGKPVTAFLVSLLLLASLYALFLFTGKPSLFTRSELFSGYIFSAGALIPSLGHLMILGILMVPAVAVFYKHVPLNLPETGKNRRRVAVLSLLFATVVLLLNAYHYIFTKLVFDSNIVFEPYRVLELTLLTFTGYLTLLICLAVPVIFLLKILSETAKFIKPAEFFTSFGISLLLFIPVAVKVSDDIIPLVLIYTVFIVTLRFYLNRKTGWFNVSVFMAMMFGLYTIYYVIKLSEAKGVEQKKVLAVAYSTEHDPEAEHLLIDIWPALSSDSLLRRIVCREFATQNDIDTITYYLHTNYFKGYWGNFNLSVVSCRHDSPLWISSEEKILDNCFDFFRGRIEKFGQRITGTDFWFLENQGGRSYYLGQIFYDLGNNNKKGLFIELYNDVDSFQEGYSELLLDKKYQGYSRLKYYSFAKYINGNLVLRTGDFPYDKTDETYVDREYDYRVFNREGYKHLLYRNGNVTVILSTGRISFVDVLISFAYIFAFTLMITGIVLLFVRRVSLKRLLYLNFRQKLQISFITLLLVSFISVGVIVAVFSVKQYKERHLETIKEKIGSIYGELTNRLSGESDLAADWRDVSNPSLNDFLIRLSNLFNTDINLYDRKGFLLATSRPEVFYRNLTSRRLNQDAFNNLDYLTKSEYLQRENIVSLEYVSAYVPFYNNEGRLLAYLNLPYFRMQSVLAREISNVIVAVANFTLLIIIITMVIVVVISRRLTAPLQMLSEGLASVQLGKKSEHLVYEGHDEIGEMVQQYNRMVDELQESARRLADSEREYAWREMAKQVAHEIKNPLTPMKLNIQQLYKSWKDGIPGFDKKLEKFTKNQIEYIETLSSIASAFSSFARMPSANPADINLVDQLRTTLELFKDTENVSFRVNWPAGCKIMVHADKEHLNGIFSNLIKNAIQSVPAGRGGVIKIGIEVKGDKAVVSVSDNGTGIPDELKAKLFTPNFTTKSSGMGLGLSIVKRYAEIAGGRVWFESEKEKGSVFYVELPVIFTVERNDQDIQSSS